MLVAPGARQRFGDRLFRRPTAHIAEPRVKRRSILYPDDN
jgi:hypothetical protein